MNFFFTESIKKCARTSDALSMNKLSSFFPAAVVSWPFSGSKLKNRNKNYLFLLDFVLSTEMTNVNILYAQEVLAHFI